MAGRHYWPTWRDAPEPVRRGTTAIRAMLSRLRRTRSRGCGPGSDALGPGQLLERVGRVPVALGHARGSTRIVLDDLVAPGALRHDERVVGPAEGGGQLLTRLDLGDPEAAGELGQPPDRDRGIELGLHGVQGAGRVHRRAIGEGDGELLAAVAGEEAVAPER